MHVLLTNGIYGGCLVASLPGESQLKIAGYVYQLDAEESVNEAGLIVPGSAHCLGSIEELEAKKEPGLAVVPNPELVGDE